jgi:peptidoglycan/LPS O-acetylase OafA/YrhL
MGAVARRLDPVWWSFGILLPFFVAGALIALFRPRDAAFVLPLAVLAQAALAVVYWGSLRMRAPVEPAIVVLAVEGLAAGFAGVRSRRHAGDATGASDDQRTG